MATPIFCSANFTLGRGWRSEMGGLGGVAELATDQEGPEGLGFGPEDLRKIRAMEIRQRRASVSL